MQKLIGIYIIINKRNGKKYIGASNNVLRRFMEHKAPKNVETSTNVLCKSFRRYGVDSFNFILLEWLDDINKLPEREKFWIKKLNPEYNMNEGGLGNVGHKVSAYVRKVISEKSKEQWDRLSLKDKKERIKNNLTGRSKNFFMTEEMKQKLRICNLGKKQSKETILKRSVSMRKAMKGNTNSNKKIGAFKKGILIKEFDSSKIASEFINVHPSCITGVLKGRRKTTGGFEWKYL
jgi:group I intron endonuclease